MSKISVYNVVPTPKLGDKLIGTSVGVVDDVFYDVTYNFTLQELLDLFIPNIPANTLQGILDYGNTATQDINLTGTINTTNLNVLATATILDSVLNGETHVLGQLYDGLNSSGTAGQILKSTGSGVEWYTIPDAVIPTLQQVLNSGNTADKNIILSANISALTATANTVVSNTSLNINGVLKDGSASVGASNQILSSTVTGVQWVDLPVYSAASPLLFDGPTKTFSIQVANSTQGGYLSNTDWINFDAKQNPISLTTTGNSGAATFVGSVLNIPAYTLSGLGGVASVSANSPLSSSGGENPIISIPMADTSHSGYLTNTDWNTFNAKQGALTLTTLGTSGPSTLVGNTLNIPTYQSVLTNPITGLGTVNYVPKFDTTSSITDSNIQDSGSLITLGSNTYVNGSLGIGTSDLTAYNLRINKNITGATTSYSILTEGTIQSDVTNARMFNSKPATVDASFTLGNLSHYLAQQGTFGASSTVTSQYGFFVDTSLTGAVNNYAFYSSLTAGTNRWNLYMAGTASNYLAGALGIGVTSLTGYSLRLALPITGSISSVGFFNSGIIQSDVTSSTYYNRTSSSTAAASFTLTNIYHYGATQGTFGAGSTVTNQYGFLVNSSLTGATNNFAYAGQLAAATNVWNLYMSGTANNYLAGSLGIGTTALTGYNLRVSKNITGATTAYGVSIDGAVQSDVTNQAHYYVTNAQTQASTFTISNIFHYRAIQGTFGLNSTVSSQAGFAVDSTLIGATNNYGFFGNIALGANRWNIYMAGTADNYLGGSLGMGSSSLTGINLRIEKNIIGGAISTANFAISVHNAPIIQSDVTSTYWGFNSQPSTVASLVLTNLIHFQARFVTLGSGASVTNQTGFLVPSNLNGGTNNYGFRGLIASASNAWNIYMDGTANNYLAGSLGIGSTSLTNITLNIGKAITGGTIAGSINNQGTIQSDVTASATYNSTFAQTIASTFSLTTLNHYYANQGTFGSGSTVTNQYGFRVDGSLISATNNYGFYGDITSGTNRWNLYMNGTANNYLAGSLGIGTTSLTGLSLAVVGLTRFTGTTVSDTASLGAELASVTGTGTNWTLVGTDLNNGGYTHTIGSVVPLTTALAAVSGTYYQIAYTITGRTAGSITISYGGTSTNTSTTGTTGPLASSTAVLTITPTTDFDGNIVLSIKSIGTSSSSFSLLNSSSTQNIDFRASNIITNTFIGLGAGRRNTTGSNNTLLGNSAGNNNTTGGANTIIGQSAGASNTIGSNNTFIGGIAGGSNLISNFNTYIGYASGTNNTGSNNTFLGFNSGRYIADGATAATILNQSILIGYNTKVLADNQTNQIVIGYNTTGLGSNTTVLGNSSTTLTAIYGAVIIGGTSTNASALLQVDSTTQGVLFPRMTTTQKNAISSPATGLVVFDTTLGKLCVFSTTWQTITSV